MTRTKTTQQLAPARALAALVAVAAAVAGCGPVADDPHEPAPPAPDPIATRPLVLVHGAWMGAWAFDDVAARIRDAGGTAFVVELPAHGADDTAVAGATLDAYVAAVEGAVASAGEPVTLVGHSMGGMVITRVAEEQPASVAELVYLAGYLPADGQSLLDLAQTDAASHIGPALEVDQEHGVARLPTDKLADIFCADCSADDAALLGEKYRDEPVAPLATPVAVTDDNWGSVARSYIFTTEDHAVSHDLQLEMTAGVELEATAELTTSHSPFLSDPGAVVDALRDVTRNVTR